MNSLCGVVLLLKAEDTSILCYLRGDDRARAAAGGGGGAGLGSPPCSPPAAPRAAPTPPAAPRPPSPSPATRPTRSRRRWTSSAPSASTRATCSSCCASPTCSPPCTRSTTSSLPTTYLSGELQVHSLLRNVLVVSRNTYTNLYFSYLERKRLQQTADFAGKIFLLKVARFEGSPC